MNDFEFSLSAVAGVSQPINARGNMVAYYEETGGGADVAIVVKLVGGSGGAFVLRPGEGVELPEAASGFVVANKNGANTIAGTLKIGEGKFSGKNIAGSVTVSNFPAEVVPNGAFTNTQKTVTNASGVLVAANAARRYLMIQNNDAAGIIYVTLDGTAATTAKGVKISAGGSYELQGFVPSGEIRAIGSIASNANCVVVEG